MCERNARACGQKLGNRTNLGEAQQLGAQANTRVADTFAANVMPIVEAIRRSGGAERPWHLHGPWRRLVRHDSPEPCHPRAGLMWEGPRLRPYG